jgi:ActR/RegA family two-component response regulator/Holliday junction resolvase-like predicted endonuclease
VPAAPINPILRVVVIDDNASFVVTLLEQFKRHNVHAVGITEPADLLRSTKLAPFAEADMVFLDMRLSDPALGPPITAADVLLHLMTYASKAKVVVFTQKDISAAECIRCIQLGALGIIPKSSDVDNYVLIGQVYRDIGDEAKAREERIRSLWTKLDDAPDEIKGQYLEMLLVNIFSSIGGLKVVHHNIESSAGEIDILIENRCEHEFWKTMDSLYLAVECRNRHDPQQKADYSVLESKVRAKDRCKVGIMVSWAGVSSGFRQRQSAPMTVDTPRLYTLDRKAVHELIMRSSEKREEYLRNILSAQL